MCCRLPPRPPIPSTKAGPEPRCSGSASTYDAERAGAPRPTELDAGGFFQSEHAHHTVNDARALLRRRIELDENVEAHAHRGDDPDPEPPRRRWQDLLIVTPHENRARLRVHDHVEAVLGTIVDHDVNPERAGDPSARFLHDEDTRQLEAFRLEPALRLE